VEEAGMGQKKLFAFLALGSTNSRPGEKSFFNRNSSAADLSPPKKI
jgi:hypothetical protein